jgi:ferritin-like metal-binding protein YciE
VNQRGKQNCLHRIAQRRQRGLRRRAAVRDLSAVLAHAPAALRLRNLVDVARPRRRRRTCCGLKDIYTAEKQMLRAMGKIARQSQSDQLRQALQRHGEETETQVERLEQVFEMLGKPARGKPCDAIEGLINEAREIVEEFRGTDALDAGLLSASQAIEHYEIARYGTLKTWAGQLGMSDAAKLLDEMLQEEKKTDAVLTKITEERVDQQAA